MILTYWCAFLILIGWLGIGCVAFAILGTFIDGCDR